MSVLNVIHYPGMGTSGVEPSILSIMTDDDTATATTAGYLNQYTHTYGNIFSDTQIAVVFTTDNKASWYGISIDTAGVITLVGEGAPGTVVLPVVDGNFSVFSGTEGVMADDGFSPSDPAKTKVVMASAAVTANHIACFSDTAGTVNDDAATAINAGNIQAGLSGTAGTLASFPATGSKGSLKMVAVANTGDTNVTVSNAAHGQATVISIPDGGQTTTEFIIADSAGTQHITSGSLQVDVGDITAGQSGDAGGIISYPAGAAAGKIELRAANAAGDFTATISNVTTLGQTTQYNLSDAGSATQSILTANIASAGFSSVLKCFDITAGFADLASGGAAGVVSGAGYKIRGIWLNSGGTNFSGGGGDRDIQISDGTAVYSLIPAATAQALVNMSWGIDVDLPFPAAVAINRTTTGTLFIAYSGGTTDYTAGSVVISFLLQKVA